MQATSASAKNCKPMIARIGLFFKTFWPSLIVGAGIVYLSLFYAASLRLDVSNPDKFSHLFAYLVWGLCLSTDLWRSGASFGKRVLWAVVMPILFGGVIELLQAYCFPPRAGEWADWYADFSGIVLAFVVTDLLYRHVKPRFLFGCRK